VKEVIRTSLLVIVTGIVLFTSTGIGNAFYPYLSEDQIKEAIHYGKDNKDTGLAFFKEWEVNFGWGIGIAQLYSPFFLLASCAQEAAREYRSVSDYEKEAALTGQGHLTFNLFLWGDSIAFGKGYHAVLLYKGKYIQPFLKKNDELAEWDKTVSKYEGHFIYDFSLVSTVDDEKISIDPSGKVTLIIIPWVGEEIRFQFDLSKIR